MAAESPLDRIRENATEITSILVTGFWLGALFTGQGWWLAALLVGYVVVVPIVAILFGDEEDREEWLDWEEDSESASTDSRDRSTDDEDPLETLRRRYAEGKLTEEQFERKVERLLETETIEDVEDRYERERERELRERN